ncbi:hypothetical protein MLD38_022757 [Melastoma candidum]|uniref:Uncharacterized protein n=1 Tax=Melastoma candidum TaxID=119954 RepID=A0ACB9QK66_9MYRT|nr:hypothetical protein MLD38_022757 [Melastoma candidum]
MEEKVQRRIRMLRSHLVRHHVPPVTGSLLETVSLRAEQLTEVSSPGNPVVIGGMVLDIHAIPSARPGPRTTTPGEVIYIRGGVARNIADCMSKLGAEPFMMSAVGLDMAGSMLLEQWKSLGLSVEGICQIQTIGTAVVCCLFDSDGEVAGGVASFEAVEKFLTPEWIQRFDDRMYSAPIAILDANLNLAAIEASCKMAAKSNVPLWFEPVSVAKSTKIVSVAKYVTYTSPNTDELLAMAHALSPESHIDSIQCYDGPTDESPGSLFLKLKSAIGVLLHKGIDLVMVTLGPKGVFLCSEGVGNFSQTLPKKTAPCMDEQLFSIVVKSCPLRLFNDAKLESRSSEFLAVHLPGLPASVKRVTGAGDCLVGATVASICSGLNIVQATSVGIAVAKATVEDVANVPSTFDLQRLAGDAEAVFHSAKVL